MNMIKGGKFASSLPPSPYSRQVSWRVDRNIMPIARGCPDEKKKGKEKQALRMHTKRETGSGEKKNPGHGLWETILAIIYDFPGCVGAMPCTRGEGKRRAKIST